MNDEIPTDDVKVELRGALDDSLVRIANALEDILEHLQLLTGDASEGGKFVRVIDLGRD